MAILGLIGATVMLTGEVIILINKIQTFTTCSMIYYTGTIVIFLDLSMTSMISSLRYGEKKIEFNLQNSKIYLIGITYAFFRYYMARKASEAKIANPDIISYFLIIGICFQIIFIAILIFVQNFFKMTSEPIICSNQGIISLNFQLPRYVL